MLTLEKDGVEIAKTLQDNLFAGPCWVARIKLSYPEGGCYSWHWADVDGEVSSRVNTRSCFQTQTEAEEALAAYLLRRAADGR